MVDRLLKDKEELEARVGVIATLEGEIKKMSSELHSAKASLAEESSSLATMTVNFERLKQEKSSIEVEAHRAKS